MPVFKSLSFVKAQAYCKQWRGHLVSIQNKEENDLVKSMIDPGKQHSPYWIGLRSGNYTTFEWTDGTPYNFSLLSVEDSILKNKCAFGLGSEFSWLPASCTAKRRFICERPTKTTLYRVSTVKTSWSGARTLCKGWGGHLAVIPSKKQEILIS